MKEIKNKLIYTLKYILLLLIVCLLICFEKSFLSQVAFLESLRLSAVICAVIVLCAPTVGACVLSGVCGLFVDFYSLSLPYFSLFYLYISFGCVWCESFFASLRGKTVFLICFSVFFVLAAALEFFDMLVLGRFFLSWEMIFEAFLFALVNSAFSPIVFAVLKRLRF